MKLREEIDHIKQTLSRIEANLAEHMRRTLLNERRIERLEGWLLGALITVTVSVVLYLVKVKG